MSRAELIVGVGGAAGEGIASTGESFAKLCSRNGLHVFAYNSYQSVIRGGHVWMQIRVGEHKVTTHGDLCDVVIALNEDTVRRHLGEIRQGGGVLYDSEKVTLAPEQLPKGVHAYGLPVMQLAKNPLMQNTISLGALMFLLQMSLDDLQALIKETFGRKGAPVVDANLAAATAGFGYAQSHYQHLGVQLQAAKKRRLFLTGNQAIAVGAVAAGCKFYSAYPMTPASSIMHWFAKHAASCGVVLKQAEDEIAAINMAVGAGHVGVRAMTGTSGGGFALMTEAIGEAGMTETPIVVVNAQRGGPSTGLPTKTEQADLFQMLGASQGDYPKALLAPSTIEEAYAMTAQAFNIAEQYQCPVIIASDLLLSEHQETVDGLPLEVPIDRGGLITGWPNGPYKRFLDTPSGVSPRAVPGMAGTVFTAATDEHAEDGIVVSDVFCDPATRVKMMNKRMRKLQGILKEFPAPQVEGPAHADLTLIGWGSTAAVIREAMQA
ncbi:MAG: 2-oxoacid:acceptor oxidoreductase subunit alpha [Candidatus Omnitrophica bacterium]|nr:2-oxoacid:acceptor oxidoreductase subunit alpha [Candidatus Omnitrophota bacterium]